MDKLYVFWLFFACLTFIICLAVIWPYWRQQRIKAASKKTDNQSSDNQAIIDDTTLYQDQLADIDAQLASGELSAQDAEAARNEAARQLLLRHQLHAQDTQPEPSASSSKLTAMIISGAVIFLLVFSWGLYGMFFDQAGEQALIKAAETQAKSPIIAAEQIVRDNPQNGTAWQQLAMLYMEHNRFDEAVNASSNALRILGEDKARLLLYFYSLVQSTQNLHGMEGQHDPRIDSTYQRLIALDQGDAYAVFLYVAVLLRQQRIDEAMTVLEQALPHIDNQHPWYARLKELDQQLRTQSGENNDR